jgi:hypothetical protein
MSDADVWSRIRPYAEQLLEDEDVHAGIRRVITGGRGAYGRARGKQRKRDAITDRGVQRRLKDSADAACGVIETIREAPRRQRRRRRRRTLTALLVGGTAVTMAASRPAREKLSRLASGDRQADPTAPEAATAHEVGRKG